ncbi:hypothetical protein H7R52_07115 [Weissella confusa]|uniref:Uncharacterized protein n=1 Tax=Weissella confusa TaxID=1583 RepID=A0A923NIR5_WEICO|nr:hypothetical protein [Weissella confusa]
MFELHTVQVSYNGDELELRFKVPVDLTETASYFNDLDDGEERIASITTTSAIQLAPRTHDEQMLWLRKRINMKFDINHVVDNILTEHEDPYVGYQMSGQGTTESAEKFFNRELMTEIRPLVDELNDDLDGIRGVFLSLGY